MNGEAMKYLVIVFVALGALAQGIVIALKIIDKLTSKKRMVNNPHPCEDHENRLRKIEDVVTRMDERLKDLVDDFRRLEGKLNGVR